MTKIEEMAQAAYEGQAKREGGQVAAWDALPLMFRFALKQTVRDALAVLREPTPAMLSAQVGEWDDDAPDVGSADRGWRAAIDAILAEDPAR